MHIYKNFTDIKKYPHPVVVMGNFDGVHEGHRKMLEVVKERAQKNAGTSVVCIYEPNTKVFFGKVKEGELLSTTEEKLSIFETIGIDVCVIFSVTQEFISQTAEAFVRDMLIEKIGMKEFVIGYDTNFGSDKKGDQKSLRLLGQKYDFPITSVAPLEKNGKVVSSTGLRKGL